MSKPVGIFDSGVGGLTVVREVIKNLPGEDIIYVGDTARVPYGNKSPQTVTRYSFEIADFLLSKDIKILVVACNTASAISLDTLKKQCKVPVVEVINPGVKKAIKSTSNFRIGVIGTEATVNSNSYYEAIKKLAPNSKIYNKACPLFVPLAEEGLLDDEITLLTAKKYLKELKKAGIDSLILGCTHYPLLKKVIKKVMGNGVVLVDSAEEVAIEVERILKENGSKKSKGTSHGNYEFFVTDFPERFKKVGKIFLGKNLNQVNQVNVSHGY
jgi:glutamate racemase